MSPLLSEAVPGYLPVSVAVPLDGHDGSTAVATAEVSAMGAFCLTGDTDLAEIERATGGYYDAAWLENQLRAEGEKAWAAWCAKHGDER